MISSVSRLESQAAWLDSFPEMKGQVMSLVRDLKKIGCMPPVLANTVEILSDGLKRMVALHDAGNQDPDMVDTMGMLSRLARQARAQAAQEIRRQLDDLRIATQVALDEAEPAIIKMEDAFRMASSPPAAAHDLVAAPVSRAVRVPRVEGTGFSDHDFGSVSGAFTYADVATSVRRRAAPEGSMILEPGHVVRLSGGQGCILHCNGVSVGDNLDAPIPGTLRSLLIEAGENGAEITGPAVISHSGLENASLLRVSQALAWTERTLEQVKNRRNIWNTLSDCLFPASVFVMVAALFCVIMASFGGALFNAGISLFVLSWLIHLSTRKVNKIAERSSILAQDLPGFIQDGSLAGIYNLACEGSGDFIGEMSAESSKIGALMMMIKSRAPAILSSGSGVMLTLPADLAMAGRDGQLARLSPLRALPPPDAREAGANVLSLDAQREKIEAGLKMKGTAS